MVESSLNPTPRRRRRRSESGSQPLTMRSRKIRRLIDGFRTYCDTFNNPDFVEAFIFALERVIEDDDHSYFKFIQTLKQPVVSIETFLDSDQFMGATDLTLWPEVRKAVIELNKDWWRGKKYGAKTELLAGGATGCVDKDTEFLTPTGWVKISEYDGQQIAQYRDDGTAFFMEPNEYVKAPCEGFLNFKNSTFDQRLTQGHRVVYRSVKTEKLQEKTAQEIATLHNGSGLGWKSGKFIGHYELGGRGLLMQDEDIRLMVAVMADGSFYKRAGHHPDYCVFHVKKERKKKRLRELLNNCGIKYNDYDRLDGYSDISFRAPECNKDYTGWWEASNAQLMIIADECLHWDGTKDRGEFYTRDKSTADFIQHVFTATGRRATINPCYRDDGSVDYVVHVVKSKAWRLASSSKQDIVPVKSEDGYCYCFKTQTGMWVSRRSGKIVVTGNTGKSEIAKVTTAFCMYILGCMNKPQQYWGIPSATAILIPILAAKPKVTKNVLYQPLRSYIELMPWFRNHMPFDKYMESEMVFHDQNIRVTPAGTDVDSILGEALPAAMLDEVNFMQIVENSRKIEAKVGRSAKYDQAHDIFNKVTRRKSGRFGELGPNVGVVCSMSSTSHPGEFTEVREAEVVRDDLAHVYVYNKAQYEVKPNDKYSGDIFHVCVHTDSAGTIELKERDEHLPKHADIYDVPIEEKDHFLRDPEGSVRDIIGRSLRSLNPFITRHQAITDAFDLGTMGDVPDIVEEMNVHLELEGMPKVIAGHYCKNPSRPRYVHIDLSHTDDRCGISMLRFDGMAEMTRQGGGIERLPTATVELAISIQPSITEGLDLAEVRMWVSKLKSQYGYPIKVVSYDGWGSLESRQQWKKRGMTTVLTSMDKTDEQYKALRDALYDGRIALPANGVLDDELRALEHDKKKGKVDHPSTCTKDIADAVGGAFWVMLQRSHTWRSADDGGRILHDGGRYSGERFGGGDRG